MSNISNVIGVECHFSGTIVEIPYLESYDFVPGDRIIYKDEEEKEEFGTIRYINRETTDKDKVIWTSKILRRVTPHDMQKIESHMEDSKGALNSCRKLVEKYELNMQAFRASFSFDASKVHFMFVSDDRVDFRELVKDLAKVLKKQIYLRQVGPRDKAKFVTGYGKCGRQFCCTSFLNKLESINMEMVRDQSLESKGSPKLSGACGKLLCCLKYELQTYREMKQGLPKVGSVVRLKKSLLATGPSVTIIALDILNQKLKTKSEEGEIMIINASDIDKVIKEGREEFYSKEPVNEEKDLEFKN